MAFEVEAWWSANYNKFSIRDLQKLPIFHRFVQIHYPFERADELHHEKFFITEGQVDIFEWTDKASDRYERFQHDRKADEYHYEIRFKDEESPVVIKSWLRTELEWGTITRNYGTFVLEEAWKLEPPNRVYERFTVERGIKKGFRAGIHPYKGDYERWVEEIWEFGDEQVFKKEWHKAGESGGETTNKKADYTWGETWSSSPKRFEKKCWHKNGDHTWGHDTGKEPPRRWDHTWDQSLEQKLDEKVTVNAGRDTGYRFVSRENDWYKQEWEGLHLLETKDKSEEVISAKIRERLDGLYVREYNSDLKQQQFLNILAAYLPGHASKVTVLENTLGEIHVKDRQSLEALLDVIDELRRLGDEQEQLTQELFGTFRDDLDLMQTFNNFFVGALGKSLATLGKIGEVLKENSAFEEYVPRVEEWKGEATNTIEKGKKAIALLSELETVKLEELNKFQGGIPKEEVEKAMDTLYQIMVKHDAVSDKIVEVTHANDFKSQLDHMEDVFGEIHKNFLEDGDPEKLHEMLNLLLEYQPIHLHLMGRLRGYTAEETNAELGAINSAVAETKSQPSLKNTRAKVRSGRPPKQTPFQVMDENLNRFAPLLQRLLLAVNAPQTDIDSLSDLLKRSVTDSEPVEVLLEKTKVISEVVSNATPSVDKHEKTLRHTDAYLNVALEAGNPILELLEGGEAAVSRRKELVSQTTETLYFPRLIRSKVKNLKEFIPVITEYAANRQSPIVQKLPEIDDFLTRFIPFYINGLRALGTPESTLSVLDELVSRSVPLENAVDALVEKAKTIHAVAEAAQPSIESHDATLTHADTNLNFLLESAFPVLEHLENGAETIALRKNLISETDSSRYFPPLILKKIENLKTHVPEIGQYIGGKLAALEALQNELAKLPDVDSNLVKFANYYLNSLRSIGVPQSTIEATEALSTPASPDHLVDEIVNKVRTLRFIGSASQTSAETHDKLLSETDANLNRGLEAEFPALEFTTEGAKAIFKRKDLISQSSTVTYFPSLLFAKSESVKEHTPVIADYLQNRLTLLSSLLQQVPEVGNLLNRFLPFYIQSLKAVGAPETAVTGVEKLITSPEVTEREIEVLLDKVKSLGDVAETVQSSIDDHNEKLQRTDLNLNFCLESTYKPLESIPGGAEIISRRKDLVDQTDSTEGYYLPLVFAKSEDLKEHAPKVSQLFIHVQNELAKVPRAGSALAKFIPYFKAHLISVAASPTDLELLDSAAEFPESVEEFSIDSLIDKSEKILESAVGAESNLLLHNQTLQSIDSDLNQYFQETFPQYEKLDGGQEAIIDPRTILIAKSEGETYFVPLVKAKTEELAGHTTEIFDMITAIEESQESTTIDFENTIKSQAFLIDDLQKKIKELEKRIKILDEDLAEAKRFKPLFEEQSDLATRLGIDLKKLNLDYTDQTLAFNAVKAENALLIPELQSLREFKQRAFDLELENSRLQGIISSYEEIVGDHKVQFDEIVAKLHDDLSKKNSEIERLSQEVKALQSAIEAKENNRRKQLMLRVILTLSGVLKAEKSNTVVIWKYWANSPEEIPPETVLDEIPNTTGFKDEEIVEDTLARFTSTEAPLVSERTFHLSSNIIARHWRANSLRFDKPATATETLKFWDELFEHMTKEALTDLESRRRPFIFSEFALEHLFKTLVSKRTVDNRLAVHLPALYRLSQEGQVFGVLFARLLHLFKGTPAPLESQIIAGVLKREFEELAERYAEKRQRKGLSPLSVSELALTGGVAPLGAVLKKFYEPLSAHPFYEEHWLRHLQSTKVSKLDFVLAVIRHQLKKDRADPEEFWSHADNGDGTTNAEKLVEAVGDYDIIISKRLLREAVETQLTQDYFLNKKPTDKSLYLVSKASFLTGILEAYEARNRRYTVELTDLFTSSSSDILSKDQFTVLAHVLDSDAPEDLLSKIYEEGLTLSGRPDGLNLDGFVRVLLRYPLGTFSKDPLGLGEPGRFTESRPKEYDLEQGAKIQASKTTTRTVVTKTTRIVRTA